MNLEEKLIEFERVVYLQSVKNSINLNFLNEADLDKIQNTAYELKIKIKEIDLDEFKHASTDELHMIYNIWSNEINLLKLKMREEILDNYGD